jgi:hypothetical protein
MGKSDQFSGGQSDEVDFDQEEIESTEQILDPFDPSKINVVRESMSIFQVMRKIDIREIKLDPDFQRNLVWDKRRQSQLIESILLKIPLPAFYLDAVEPNQWVVVDGLQRLSTLDAFCNKKSLSLSGLEFLSQKFEGMSFDQLPRSARRDIEETQLTMYIIRPETPPKVKFTIFHRINTGGMVLTAQEIRHATFPGRAPRLLSELAASEEFKAATAFSVNPNRMDDRECVLRHLAFRITNYTKYTKPDLNDFLGSAMEALNKASEEQIDRLAIDFKRAMTLCKEIFGPYAFRKFNREKATRGPISKALFETWSTVVLDVDEEKLLEDAKNIMDFLERSLQEDQDYIRALTYATGGLTPVRKRFAKAYQIIETAWLL